MAHPFSFMPNRALVFLLCLRHFSLAIVDSVGPLQSLGDGETLVSKQGVFELGFFSPGNSKSHYIGIWYKKIAVRTVVWVANRCNPITDSSGLFMINSTGNLLLFDQNKSSVAWSTSISKRARKPILQLLDSGNLVVRDEQDVDSETNYLWQSFDYPLDKMLPGMKLGWDLKKSLNRRLTAWKDREDPCPGDLSFGYEISLNKPPEANLLKGQKKVYRVGPWNGIRASGVPVLTKNQLFTVSFFDTRDEAYYTYSLMNDSVVSILVINQTTSTLARITWIEADQTWKTFSSEPRDYCDNYGLCGGNTNCLINEAQVCQCLKGFSPRSPEKWNSTDWSDGCVRNHELICGEKEKEGFVKFAGLKIPDATNSWGNKSMSLKECREKCMSNCSCSAYANSDVRGSGSGCIIWFGDLMDIRKSLSTVGQDLYIRMSASEITKGDRKIKVTVSIVVAVFLFVMFAVGGVYICKKPSKGCRNTKCEENNVEDHEESMELPLFDLSAIIIASSNFCISNKLGQGGYGPVYKGKLEDGREIAVKRLCMNSKQGLDEFKNEVMLISKLQHRNLVKLLGCCIQGEEKLLVYEFMPNKSLDFFIFDKLRRKLLKWPIRLQIICGIARGLQYLHQDSRLRIIHRDLKASNILLDKEMNPKISDFGIARSFGGDQMEGNTNRVVGTYGYMAPEYAIKGLFSTKSDVFSFGIMMLEIISGKQSQGFKPEVDGNTLTGHAWTLMKEGRAFELVDGCLRDSIHGLEEVLRCINIALLCVQQRTSDRPTMSSVLVMLSSENVLPEPKLPGYFMERDTIGEVFSSENESSSTNKLTITSLEAR